MPLHGGAVELLHLVAGGASYPEHRERGPAAGPALTVGHGGRRGDLGCLSAMATCSAASSPTRLAAPPARPPDSSPCCRDNCRPKALYSSGTGRGLAVWPESWEKEDGARNPRDLSSALIYRVGGSLGLFHDFKVGSSAGGCRRVLALCRDSPADPPHLHPPEELTAPDPYQAIGRQTRRAPY